MAPTAVSLRHRDDGPLKAMKPSYTWKEVAQHSTAESAWVIFGDGVYDVTSMLDSHPGGREMLLLAAGRDVTDFLPMYHSLAAGGMDRIKTSLAPMRVGDFSGPTEFPRFAPDTTGFYDTLVQRVRAYLKTLPKGASRSPVRGLLSMIPVFVVFFLTFAVTNNILPAGVAPFPFWVRFLAAAVYGVAQVMPLMHWAHDASHGSLGPDERWWQALGRVSMDWIAGANMMPWLHQHIIGHHVHTNVFEGDPDLPLLVDGDPRKIVARQSWKWLYRYQFIYLPLVYGVLGIKIRISDIVDFVFRKMNGPVRVNHYENVVYRVFFVKAVFVAWRLGIPMYCGGLSLLEAVGWMLVGDFAAGYWLAYNFQVSHLTEDVAWPNGDKKEEVIPDSWAVNQVKTSLDYGHGSWLTTYLSGALNYQIEHHLFPGISQYLYPSIAPIVKQTCKEFNLPYRYEKNFWGAFTAHIRFLAAMGAQGKAVHMD